MVSCKIIKIHDSSCRNSAILQPCSIANIVGWLKFMQHFTKIYFRSVPILGCYSYFWERLEEEDSYFPSANFGDQERHCRSESEMVRTFGEKFMEMRTLTMGVMDARI